LNELALFAGAGGGILGGKLLGWRTVCAVEWEPYPASVLCARQNDGILPPFPIWDDVETFDGKPWKGIVDVVSGGFPCQDISSAGKGAGINGKRSGMWSHMARVVSEIRPRYVFVENSPMLITRGLERVLGDLTKIGYDTKWFVMGASDVGANHQRDRIWILGHTNNYGQITSQINKGFTQRSNDCKTRQKQASEFAGSSEQYAELADTNRKPKGRLSIGTEPQNADIGFSCSNVSDTSSIRHSGSRESIERMREAKEGERQANIIEPIGKRDQWSTEPRLGRVANGVAYRLDRLKAIGNGQVPLAAATAFKELIARFV